MIIGSSKPDVSYVVDDARVGHRVKKDQQWSDKYPGYLFCGGNKYRIFVQYRGRPANKYCVEVACAACAKLHLQDVSNARRGATPTCSKECRSVLMKSRSAGNKVKKPRSSGHHVMVVDHSHPRRSRHNYVYEHVLVAEKSLGRYLLSHERVHHVDCIKNNNSFDNLFICSSEAEHFRIHGSLNLCVSALMKMGVLYFDPEEKRYLVKGASK